MLLLLGKLLFVAFAVLVAVKVVGVLRGKSSNPVTTLFSGSSDDTDDSEQQFDK